MGQSLNDTIRHPERGNYLPQTGKMTQKDFEDIISRIADRPQGDYQYTHFYMKGCNYRVRPGGDCEVLLEDNTWEKCKHPMNEWLK